MIAKLANKPHNHGDVNFFHAYTSLKLSNDTPVPRATNLCPWCDPPVTVTTPDFFGNPEIPKNVLYPPPPNLPKRLIRGGVAGRGATVRPTLRDRKRTKTGKLSGFDAPDVPPGLSSPENFRVSRRSRRVPHQTRAPLMYSTAAPGVGFGVFSKFQTRKTGHFADPNTLQGLFS